METGLFRRHSPRPGAAPGEFTAPRGAATPVIRFMRYDAERMEERDEASLQDVLALRFDSGVTWIDVQGIGDVNVIAALGSGLGLHPLAIADVANIGQRPKIESYGDILFCVLWMATLHAGGDVEWEQVSLFVGKGFVLTFQETPGDCLEPLRHRIRQGKQPLREAGSDYLGSMVIDAIVDGYFPVLEMFGERMEGLENRIIAASDRSALSDVYRLKRELMKLRRVTWPLRDMLNQMLRDRHPLFAPATLPYLRDAADHAMQVVDVVETYRELSSSFIEVHLASVSNRINEVMRVLTALASVFVPLTFLAGVYGMNFDTSKPGNMPELSMPYAYIGFWAVSILLAVVMFAVFRRMGWLRSAGSRRRHRGRPSVTSSARTHR